MKKIIRTNNLQKALEDYDALKGQAVSYVSVLPESPNIRNSVYCKQTTTDIEEGRTLTVGELIENFAQETETANHFVIPATYTITYSNDVVKGIEVSGDAAIMYEDEEFTTALATTFNLEDNYIFDVTTHVTEMAYYMGDVTNQTLHPVVSFGVIAEVNTKIDRVERELDAKIDNNYNTLDNKIDNEISNLAVNFTTNNLVANVATVNNAVVSSLNVAEIIANGSAGTNGQILGKVNGNLEWQDFPTDNFVVNNITVNKNAVADNATINNMVVNNAVTPRTVTTEVSYYEADGVTPASGATLSILESYTGFGEPGTTTTNENFQFLPFLSIGETEYNDMYVSNSIGESGFGYAYKNVSVFPLAFVVTAPFGNIYFAGQKIIEMNLIPNVDGVEITPNASTFANSVVTPTLTFTADPVTNNLSVADVNVKLSSVLGSSYYNKTQANLPYGINANGIDITTNINNTQFVSFDYLFYNKQSMTDCFITNSSLILNAPSGYNVLNNVSSMAMTFYNCKVFNQPITIPDSVTNMNSTFGNCKNFNQPVTIPDSVTSMHSTFNNCYSFNQSVTIGNGVTDMNTTFGNCRVFNQPITIPDSVINMSYTFMGCYNFNQPITIPDSVIEMAGTFDYCYNFNSPVIIGNGVTNMPSTFYYCNIFNQSVTIPDSVRRLSQAFKECHNFNKPVTIGNGVADMFETFCNCYKFNQPIFIPDSVHSMYQMICMYPGATGEFNSPVTIGKGITNMSAAFYGQPIFANSTVPIHISHEIALGDTSNYIYNMLVNNGVGIIIDPSRILNDA